MDNEGGLILTPRVTMTDDGKIAVKTQYHQKDMASAIPGARYDRKAEVWKAPLSWGTAWALRVIFGDRIVLDDDVLEWIRKYHVEHVAEAMRIRDEIDISIDADWADDLFTFQRVGVEFLVTTKRALLADDMGTGKTVQTISALRRANESDEYPSSFPALIVCPNSMKKAWAKEFETWYPGTRVEIMQGSAAKRRASIQKIDNREADVLIVNWEALKSHTRLSPYGSVALRRCKECGGEAATTSCEVHPRELNDIKWNAVIADEAHRAKNAKAKQTRALWYVAHQQPCYRFALTGTPIANHPGDLWSILHFIAPEDWPSKVKYTDLYCLVGWNPWGGHDILDLDPRTRDQFNSVFHPRFLRRPKDAVLRDLPPKVYQTRYVEMTAKQKRAYNQLEKNFIAELKEGVGFTTNPLIQMMRLMQLSSSFADVTDENEWTLTTPSSKIDELLEIVEDAGDESIVVFAESRQLINLAEQALSLADVQYVSIHGGVHVDDRQEAVDRFQKKEVPVILLTLGAGGEGITLTEADIMVFLQRSWSMVKNRQAEDRVHRIGLSRPVTIIDLIAPDTVEEHRMQVLTDKDAKLENLVQDTATIKRLLGLGI